MFPEKDWRVGSCSIVSHWAASPNVTMAANQGSPNKPGPVVVSAGRRVDAADASIPRFPLQNVPAVRAAVETYLRQLRPSAIVASAACGADLILLQAGLKDQIPCYVLLPSSPAEFRESSVTDRPGEWGAIYDQVLQGAALEELKLPSGHEGYLAINNCLLDKAQALAAGLGTSLGVLVIWNQESRGEDDVTEHFLREANWRKLPVSEISTL